MLTNISYNRNKAVSYAYKWALSRNPKYYNFDGIGGDCTNFVSQCIHAGCEVMNYTRNVGWYYKSPNDRAAAWTGVEYLHRFLTTNKNEGPHGKELPISQIKYAEPGDIIQLNYTGDIFGHSLFIVETHPQILVAQHSSENFYGKPFSDYWYDSARLIKIEGARR